MVAKYGMMMLKVKAVEGDPEDLWTWNQDLMLMVRE